MSAAEIPDVEKVVSKYLRSETGDRLVGKTPDDTDASWVRLTLLDAPAVDGARHDHLIAALVQLDCYAGEEGGQPEAVAVGKRVRAALVDAADHDHDGATVTGVAIRSHARIPDAVLKPARERVIITATIWIHA